MRLGLFENPSYHRPAAEPPSLQPGTLPRQRVRLGCGEVSYLRHGSGTPLLLVHGIPTSARLWEPLLGDLGERFDCIVPDLLGLGQSRPNPGADLASPGQAAMLTQLLDALGIDRTLAAFHDQGGAHGLTLLRSAGDRVRAAALCDVVCYDNWTVPVISTLGALCRFPAALRACTGAGLTEGLLNVWGFPQTTVRAPLPRALVGDWLAPMGASGDALDAFCGYVRAQSNRHTADTATTLRAWNGPLQVVWGGHDWFLSPSWGAQLCSDAPTAPDQPTLLPFAGHFFHADVPRTAARVLADFFASVDG